MNLKQFVNTPDIYQTYMDMLTQKVQSAQTSLETAREPADMYRLQGQLFILRRLMLLRDEVNKEK